MKKIISFLSLLFLVAIVNAQEFKVYPSNWWTGMKLNKIQLMVHSKDGTDIQSVSFSYPGIQLLKVTKAENPHYAFVDMLITPVAKPGIVKININNKTVVNFPVNSRRVGNGKTFAQGLSSSDFVYLLMPDRFSNGDPSNDVNDKMRDQSLNRDSIYHRHGGDLQGVINHLDYLQSLGVTALWMTPVIENDMPERTEHGYAFTDHYSIEPRFGGAAVYKQLSNELHKRGMKLVQDAVYNHVGSYHFTVLDPPMKDWLHQWPAFTQTSYKDQPLFDMYASESDKKKMSDGWFTRQMPDMNQQNAFVANYLIQHAIWSVEEFGIDAWRIDTYIYNDLNFMNRCNKALTDEYPNITMFGETWVHGIVNQAYFTKNKLNVPFKSNLTGVTDFQTNMYGIVPALTQKFGWTDGVNKLYNTLANDVVYENPMNHVIFLDNHDMSRFASQVGESLQKQKMGIAWLLTCRGIPQMYYGTEVMMKGVTNPDGWVRLDFPGGWKGDVKNAFTQENLQADEAEVLALTKRLGSFRKTSTALKTGKLMQYVPEDGVYVYFRYDNNQTVMCIMNTSDKQQPVDCKKYAERTKNFSNAFDVVKSEQYSIAEPLLVEPMTMLVLELK